MKTRQVRVAVVFPDRACNSVDSSYFILSAEACCGDIFWI